MPFSDVRRLRIAPALVAGSLLAIAAPEAACAGGGPENVLLVVNQRSWGSLTLANHYLRLRDLPAINVVYLDWNDDNERIDAATLREKLLGPVTSEIDRRHLNDHVDYIVYSSDFPWSVDCTADAAAQGVKPNDYQSPYASLTGATFLYQSFLQRRLDYLSLESNGYFQKPPADGPPTSRGLRSWYGWAPGGELLEAGGERYALAAMLGVSSGRGNSVDEIVEYLQAAAGADFTRPRGTIYYCRNDDVRSKTREPLFAAAVAAVRAEGVAAEIVEGQLPVSKPDVMGAMIGAERFDWKASNSRILPGALCEHLTSIGGVLADGASQTPLTDSLRAGAAASSGAVNEPFAIPNKFPTPYMHLHYVRGCSAAEAYYQSVHAPYQLLFVGDPLCRPFAAPPRVTLADFDASRQVAGVVRFTPSAEFAAGVEGRIARFELFVDGLFIAACRPGESFDLDTRQLPDGHHDLRVVAACAGRVETRGRYAAALRVANGSRSLRFERRGAGRAEWGKPLVFAAEAPEAIGIAVIQGTRRLGLIEGAAGELAIDPQTLGTGPVKIQAVALGRTGTAANLISSPLEIDVVPPPPSPTYQIVGGAKFAPGMQLKTSAGRATVVTSMAADNWLERAGLVAGESFTLTGYFNVDETAVYQLRLKHDLQAAALVDDRTVYDVAGGETRIDYAALPLQRGLHKLEVRGTVGERPRLEIRLGLRGTRPLRPASMAHIP